MLKTDLYSAIKSEDSEALEALVRRSHAFLLEMLIAIVFYVIWRA